MGLMLVKLSTTFLYLRVLHPLAYRRTCYVAFAVIGLSSSWTILSSIIFCLPVQKSWIPSPSGRCFDVVTHMWASSLSNIATDLYILVLPLLILRKMRQTLKRRFYCYVTVAFTFWCVF
ncbi:PTH11-like integral membrane protein [Colletotrichum chrysophilum]|uniref:PTH11-like integral membrane protein n=1 Tax=Colletotrichum chrysophilum TaxID=1836956 RepID=A0AAD9E7E4_9PEZI|nr:PTH11-like integral membrane protein [Colletotrichum chrysophilum]